MAWIMVGDQLTNTDFPTTPGKPFVGDSPYTMWRVDPNANEGMPYLGQMIGVPVLSGEQIDYLPITYKKEKLRFFMMLLAEPEDTNYLYEVDENGYVTLIRYLGNNTNVKTPRKIGGHTVKYISPICYSYNTNIRSIKIPNGIEVIE
jgi:hypothetical protein